MLRGEWAKDDQGVYWRAIGEKLAALPAYMPSTHSPSPAVVPPVFDPEVGLTTSHDMGVW